MAGVMQFIGPPIAELVERETELPQTVSISSQLRNLVDIADTLLDRRPSLEMRDDASILRGYVSLYRCYYRGTFPWMRVQAILQRMQLRAGIETPLLFPPLPAIVETFEYAASPENFALEPFHRRHHRNCRMPVPKFEGEKRSA